MLLQLSLFFENDSMIMLNNQKLINLQSMPNETVVLIDDEGTIKKEFLRQEAHQRGFLHSIVVVYLFDTKGNILIQQRMDGRFDHSAAGHVDKGETYKQAAIRELAEEIGVSGVELINLGMSTSREVHPERNEDISHIFKIFGCNGEPGVLQDTEVKKVFWANPYQTYKEIQKDPQENIYTGGFRESLTFILEDGKFKKYFMF